jgi:hypothetical protein
MTALGGYSSCLYTQEPEDSLSRGSFCVAIAGPAGDDDKRQCGKGLRLNASPVDDNIACCSGAIALSFSVSQSLSLFSTCRYFSSI